MRASVVQHSTTLSLYDATGFYNSSSAALRAFWQTSPDYDTRPFRTASSFPSMTSLSNNIPYIASLYFDGSDGFYNINGGSYTSTSSTGQFNSSNISIGCSVQSGSQLQCFNGYIAEVIIYDRDLNLSERQKIESYLSKKYNISLTQ